MDKYEFSLLWPKGIDKSNFTELPKDTVEDLNLKIIIDSITKNRNIAPILMDYLIKLPTDIEIVRHRQASFRDLMENRTLRDVLNRVSPFLDSMLFYHGRARREDSSLFEMIFRINELSNYVKVVRDLEQVLRSDIDLISNGFIKLKSYIKSILQSEDFILLESLLPGMISSIKRTESISLGINLNSGLVPTGVTIEKINNYKFKSPGQKIFATKLFPNTRIGLVEFQEWDEINQVLSPLLQKVSKTINKACDPIINRIKEFRSTNTSGLINLKRELDFLLKFVDLFLSLPKELPYSFPEVFTSKERIISIKNGGNLSIYLSQKKVPVPNDILLNKERSFGVITGPNSGGKTAYLQSIGLNQILAQSGLYIIGKKGKISIVDNIFTHYQIEEKPEDSQGRFGVEIKKLRDIFSKATDKSLLLFNETLSSTGAGEGADIGREILKYISFLGARGVYTTHIKSLTNNENGNHFNLYAEIVNGVRTFKIVSRVDESYSHGKELAYSLGISYSQLKEESLYLTDGKVL